MMGANRTHPHGQPAPCAIQGSHPGCGDRSGGHRQVVDLVWWLEGLVVVAIAARYKGYRYPIEVIGHAVWLYHRFALSLATLRS